MRVSIISNLFTKGSLENLMIQQCALMRMTAAGYLKTILPKKISGKKPDVTMQTTQ